MEESNCDVQRSAYRPARPPRRDRLVGAVACPLGTVGSTSHSHALLRIFDPRSRDRRATVRTISNRIPHVARRFLLLSNYHQLRVKPNRLPRLSLSHTLTS